MRCSVKPYMIEDLVNDATIKEVIKGKLVFSLAAGVTLPQMTNWMPASRTLYSVSCHSQ